jgi:hypothetical protein
LTIHICIINSECASAALILEKAGRLGDRFGFKSAQLPTKLGEQKSAKRIRRFPMNML